MKTTLLIPTLNEIYGMRQIMPRIGREWVDQIIIVDGGSTDGTVEYARENGYFVLMQRRRGIRAAYVEALPYIEGDVLITFSPDGNSIPELIPDLIVKMHAGYDMVIASRYLGTAKSEDDTIVTAFGNWLFTRTVNILHGGDYTDVMVIFRAYKKSLVYELELEKCKWYRTPETLFFCLISWEPLLSVRAARKKLKVTEILGDEPPRIGGQAKLRIWRWDAAYYFQILREFLLPFRGGCSRART